MPQIRAVISNGEGAGTADPATGLARVRKVSAQYRIA
jgi:hypothetical protein